eukprot:9846863-Prorocentrum_lima.AAC.1
MSKLQHFLKTISSGCDPVVTQGVERSLQPLQGHLRRSSAKVVQWHSVLRETENESVAQSA